MRLRTRLKATNRVTKVGDESLDSCLARPQNALVIRAASRGVRVFHELVRETPVDRPAKSVYAAVHGHPLQALVPMMLCVSGYFPPFVKLVPPHMLSQC